ncbi:hypothetical protein [Aliiglaciecola litoralis]|uniref:Uncharacterized protein n=1 Tax=Aliiglaciecola litoralis TaxID=582857 RepID=A0ABN1LQJ0_9ALTE
MNNSNTYEKAIADACAPFIEELGDKIQWQWDEHFSCYLAEFSVDHENLVYLVAQKHFPHVWDKKSIKKAPPAFRHRAGFFNTLEKNQQLMSKDRNGEHDIMLSWWPWGHGATVSVRLFYASTKPYIEPSGVFATFSKWWNRSDKTS